MTFPSEDSLHIGLLSLSNDREYRDQQLYLNVLGTVSDVNRKRFQLRGIPLTSHYDPMIYGELRRAGGGG